MKDTHLRFPNEDLYNRVKESAESNKRSLNNEILYAIEAYLSLAPLARVETKPAKEVKPKKSPK